MTPTGILEDFRVVRLSADGAGYLDTVSTRGAAIACAQAAQHRANARGNPDGEVYEVLNVRGESVWRGELCREGIHPRTDPRRDARAEHRPLGGDVFTVAA
jgi:hypothetical protein